MQIKKMLPVVCVAAAVQAADKPNILMIAVDDLRPELNLFGEQGMVTPNFDRLAARGTVFQRAYCQFAVCGPSRASLMSGLRPNRERFVIDRRQPDIDTDAPGTLTLSRYLKENGYKTQSLGKIYHSRDDNMEGWSVPPWRGPWSHNHYNLPENEAVRKKNGRYGPAFECADVPDEAYPDGLMAAEAVRRIETAATDDQPFFIAVGFWRPHLPFNAPKKYWDLYPADQIELADNLFAPKNTPAIAMHNSPEVIGYEGIPRPIEKMSDDLARTMIRAYRACVSFSDANIGKLLDALERSGQAENTVIVLWGDHGWHLGENALWGKESNFERSLRTTLMAVDPRVSKGGEQADALVELVDIYPTLCELAGLPVPEHVEGRSFTPLLSDVFKPWKKAVFSCFVRPDRDKAGMSVRDDRYRYTEWCNAAGDFKGHTLFDLKEDPEENSNIADNSEMEPVVGRMKKLLSSGWKPIQ
ncbi:sulfatase [Tichowtungia aerotolerans]|uniref:Sulfatase-like hydrolase/transferase n=1 Tax=Tichowtungia aerotolerans TaxID=2697043 RepID=A0A6P1M0G0_9BACT|nr:sulfatase [Tichowtungia aerotolerans]QHI68279.1 sulfatase-like hydrolase/transferase [Tichowtungia aerotolerans]